MLRIIAQRRQLVVPEPVRRLRPRSARAAARSRWASRGGERARPPCPRPSATPWSPSSTTATDRDDDRVGEGDEPRRWRAAVAPSSAPHEPATARGQALPPLRPKAQAAEWRRRPDGASPRPDAQRRRRRHRAASHRRHREPETSRPAARRAAASVNVPRPADFGELRQTPYGLRPALIIGFAALLPVFDAEVVPRWPRPTSSATSRSASARSSSCSSSSASSSSSSSLAVGWWADRHKRVPLVGIGGHPVRHLSPSSAAGAGSLLSLGATRVADQSADEDASRVPQLLAAGRLLPAGDPRAGCSRSSGMLSASAALLAPLSAWDPDRRMRLADHAASSSVPRSCLAGIARPVLPARARSRGYLERMALGRRRGRGPRARTSPSPSARHGGPRGRYGRCAGSSSPLISASATGVFDLLLPVLPGRALRARRLRAGLVFLPAVVVGALRRLPRRRSGRPLHHAQPGPGARCYGCFELRRRRSSVLGYGPQPPARGSSLISCAFGFGARLIGPADHASCTPR